VLGVLGKGSYGEVRLAVHKLSKLRAAVKSISRAKLDAKLRKRVEAEVKLHRQLRHPHVVRLLEVISSSSTICLCMQYAPGGTLREVLDTRGALSEPVARRYTRQMLGALHYCHNVMHIVHRDLKLDNMLLDADDNLLIADFGFADSVGASNRKLKLLCGSPHYSAPEIFAQQEYVGSHVDLWSLGVLIYTLLNAHFPFQAASMEALGKKVMRGKWDRPLNASAAASALVHSILTVAPAKRATLDDICQHEWVLAEAARPEDVIPFEGQAAAPWNDEAAAKLDQMGCSAALVKFHVGQDAHNHVTAAYELMLADHLACVAQPRPAEPAPTGGAAAEP
jgi:serine/threonine protein kinase